MGEEQDEAHEELRQHKGQHVAHGDGDLAHTELAGDGDKTRLAALQHLGAHDAGEAGPVRHGNADRHAPETLAQGIRDEDEQDDVRDAHHEVDEPGHDRVGALAAQCGEGAQGKRDERGDACGEKAHQHARGEAGKRAREHVTAHAVGAEQVLPAGGDILGREVGNGGLRAYARAVCDDDDERNGGEDEEGERELSSRSAPRFGLVKHGLGVCVCRRGACLRGSCASAGLEVRHGRLPS